MVQVHHDEGVANRIDPESCADTREGIGEALTGERIGQPLSRESTLILGADVVPVTEGNTDGRDNASAQTARRGLRHWHVRTLRQRPHHQIPGIEATGWLAPGAEILRRVELRLDRGYHRCGDLVLDCEYVSNVA